MPDLKIPLYLYYDSRDVTYEYRAFTRLAKSLVFFLGAQITLAFLLLTHSFGVALRGALDSNRT